ncbi:hypothetical protein [Paractinoplanes toevensis]|uniref:Uncharacterized protein n=1 Tax=Paractinoplanes toevensis TaxID=571911 RepID=A0A919WDH5_9ACTN|nr:hypothetical protein [Actinoplanes toevensis]GIM98255.1 hypothetical protein Ato02nite_100480 [Actinoplanes toevensis]
MMRSMIIGADFVDQLEAVVPEAHNIVVEHFAGNDGLLLHLLMSDLLRFSQPTLIPRNAPARKRPNTPGIFAQGGATPGGRR